MILLDEFQSGSYFIFHFPFLDQLVQINKYLMEEFFSSNILKGNFSPEREEFSMGLPF